jgi:hypothetical protein
MKEALKLALEALIGARAFLESDAPVEIWGVNDKAITAIKAALAQQADHSEQHLDMVKAQQEPWCMKMNGCKTKCEDCPVEVAQQEPVAIKRMKEWIEYLKRKSDFGQHMKIPCEISAGTCWELAIELEQFINTTPPQPEERNFCPRCGKRTADLTVIHTCTPPQENT